MTDPAIDILYQDDHLVAVNKPTGIMVHPSRMAGRQRRFVLQTVRDRIGRRLYPIHRVDRPTSGVLVFALSPEAARAMAAHFTARKIRKTYLAVVRGFIDEAGTVDDPLRRKDQVGGRAAPPQEARTDYRRLATVELPHPVGPYETARYSLVEAFPLTGRMHQIRRHLNHIAHPIAGDRRYGDNRHNRFFADTLNCPRLLLAAVSIAFPHPSSGNPLTIDAPLDLAFAAILDRFGWLERIPAAWRPLPAPLA